MDEQALIEIVSRTLWIVLECAGPLLVIGGGVGLLISIIQAATHLNEPSLTFTPKIISLGASLVYLGPWILDKLTALVIELYTMIETVPRG